MSGDGVEANDVPPDTAASPFAALPALRRAAYAPGATAAMIAEAERLTALLAEERLRSQRDAAAAPTHDPGSPPPGGLSLADSAPREPEPRRSVFHRPWLIAGIAAVIGIALGAGIGNCFGAPAAKGGDALPTMHLTQAASTIQSLESLQRAQRAADIPAVSLRGAVQQSSLRRLLVDPTNGEGVYAARTADGQVCLLRARSMYTVSCVDPETFGKYGLSIGWVAIVVGLHDKTAEGEGRLVVFAAQWQPNGHVQVGVVPK